MASKASIPKIVSSIKPEALASRALPVAKETIIKFGTKLIADVGGDQAFQVKNPRVVKYLKDFGGQKIVGINNTSRTRIGNMLGRMVDAGKTTDEMVKAVGDKFDEWSEGRIKNMVRTEIGAASNFGSLEGMKQAGVEQKEWLATQDNVVRDTHSELDGTVIDADDEFESPDGGTALYPGGFGDPAEDANCRCGVLPVVNDKRFRGTHLQIWKSLEADRKPYDRKMRSAFAKGLAAQKAACIAALRSAA